MRQEGPVEARTEITGETANLLDQLQPLRETAGRCANAPLQDHQLRATLPQTEGLDFHHPELPVAAGHELQDDGL